jgi:asparagine synthase (glutamine-hydrolysing)
MCGICGFVGINEPGLLGRMTASISHRGPDDDGFYEAEGVGLGMRRLSIIDVAGGHQPIENEDGSLVIVFNGEIYNYRPLREELLAKGHTLRTHSDTEVILHLYEDMGPRCLERLNGMWGLAIWDKRRRRLFIARDRLGVKPLYYLDLGDRFLFGSELKTLLRYRGWQPTLDPNGVDSYLKLRYVPGPGGMFREVRKLPAAHYAIVEDGRVTVGRYWEPELYSGPFTGSDEEYLEGFAEQFERSVRMRLISEVPLGAYLSGGIDSGTIVAVMARQLSEPVRTFTVGFDYQHDELQSAADTAARLGCRHTEISCRAEDVELLPKIVWHLDEPLGDPITIPMFQLAHEAKKQVTVILAGEGADETLGGYLFHRALLRGNQLARWLPRPVRRAVLEPALALTPASVLNLAFDYPANLGVRGKQKVQDFLRLLDPQSLPDAYHHLISLFDSRDTTSLYTADFRSSLNGHHLTNPSPRALASDAPFLNRIIDLQFRDWLPEDILMKQDKLSMASGIEVRVPFLDYQLVEYLLRVPPRLKIRGASNKHLLRAYAARYLPASAVDRRKMPFYVPLENFLGHARFRDLVEDTLGDRTVRERGLFQPEAVRGLRDALLHGEFLVAKQVFSLVVLELWCRMALDRRGEA